MAGKTYSQNEVFRTAFKYLDGTDSSGGFGHGLKHGVNQVCICCKGGSSMGDGKTSGHVDRIIDPVELKPWTDFYTSGANEFAAYRCLSCGYQWSWYRSVSAQAT